MAKISFCQRERRWVNINRQPFSGCQSNGARPPWLENTENIAHVRFATFLGVVVTIGRDVEPRKMRMGCTLRMGRVWANCFWRKRFFRKHMIFLNRQWDCKNQFYYTSSKNVAIWLAYLALRISWYSVITKYHFSCMAMSAMLLVYSLLSFLWARI